MSQPGNRIDPWKNNVLIRIIAVLDMIFGCILCALYIRKLFVPIIDSEHSMPSFPLRFLLLIPISVNVVQIVMAYNLLLAVRNQSQDVFVSMGRATMWFQAAVVFLILICLKLFVILLFSPANEIFGVLFSLGEISLKTFGLYVVKEFMEDLKNSLMPLEPNVQYVPIFPPPTPILQSINNNGPVYV